MKYVVSLLFFSLLLFSLDSCKKDEGKPPVINFKTGAGYTTSDTTVAGGTILLVGIHAAKAEDADVLKHFNVSATVDGVANQTLDDIELTGTDGDVYDVDYNLTIPDEAGHTYKFTFTVTNRDGLTSQVFLTVTAN